VRRKVLFALAVIVAVACAVPVAQLSEEAKPAVVQAATPVVAVAAPVVADLEKKTDDVEKMKQSALEQVMAFVTEMAQPMSDDEHKALKEIISTGSNILVEAEKKAREVHAKLETMNLFQGDNNFGVKEDGSIDADKAADQITNILSSLTSSANPLTGEEKNVLHELISGFAKAFSPTKETTQALQSDFEKLTEQFTSKIGGLIQELVPTGNHDDLVNPQTLLSMFNDEKGFDTKMLTDLTEKFLDTMEKQFSGSA